MVILGATGSIGSSALKVAADLPDQLRVVGLAARENVEALAALQQRWKPKAIAVFDPGKAAELKRKIGISPRPSSLGWTGRKAVSPLVYAGQDGLCELAAMPEADIVLIAIVGTAGLKPALAAIGAGKDIAVASKEILVMAGEIVMREARKRGVRVLPVDSEHSAIFQCLEGRGSGDVRRIILTASGGPFRALSRKELGRVTVADALKHPTWSMGRKITIDSATLMNKGLEMIEARWLFGVEMKRVEVVIHPQSIVHSMVEFVDGSTLAQLSYPDMCNPIQYALLWPRRFKNSLRPLNFAKIRALTFEPPDQERFPALRLARTAGETCGTMPAVFNAANEVAVEKFVAGAIRFPQIWETVERVMARHRNAPRPSLEQILAADTWARQEAGRD